ncbi:hypothetical protein GBZ48_30330 [Azospirillum melinis]|uniref:Transposase n=1 Tax=Azospirillum melinis TaxID=328839 RepID=A0ABX2KPX2_9PROT|nr:hypothetical protein [Azospirillum melinis]
MQCSVEIHTVIEGTADGSAGKLAAWRDPPPQSPSPIPWQAPAVLRVAALKHRIGREDRRLYDLSGRSGSASAA